MTYTVFEGDGRMDRWNAVFLSSISPSTFLEGDKNSRLGTIENAACQGINKANFVEIQLKGHSVAIKDLVWVQIWQMIVFFGCNKFYWMKVDRPEHMAVRVGINHQYCFYFNVQHQ